MTKTTTAQLRMEAGYTTGSKKDRCSSCAMCIVATKLEHTAIRSDRHCTELDVPVSASAICNFYLPGRNNDEPAETSQGLAA